MKTADLTTGTVYAVKAFNCYDRAVVLFPAMHQAVRDHSGKLIGYRPHTGTRKSSARTAPGIPVLRPSPGYHGQDPITDAELVGHAELARAAIIVGGMFDRVGLNVGLVHPRAIERTWTEHQLQQEGHRRRQADMREIRERAEQAEINARGRVHAVLGDQYPHFAHLPREWGELEALCNAYANRCIAGVR